MSGNGAYYCSNYYSFHQCKNQVRNWGEKCHHCTSQGQTTVSSAPAADIAYTNPFTGSLGKSEFLLAPCPSEKLNPTRRGSIPGTH